MAPVEKWDAANGQETSSARATIESRCRVL